MESAQRRDHVLTSIQESEKPLSASVLAQTYHVSRQLIVGDVALLRAAGHMIIATPRGYVLEEKQYDGIVRTIAVVHKENELADEIYTVVDLGGIMIDVIVEHPVYGQLSGKLHIASRYDADQFLDKVANHEARPLSNLTNGLHLHTVKCKDEEAYQRILSALQEKGYLYQK